MVTLYQRMEDGSTRYVTITDRQGNLFGYYTLTVNSGRDFFMTSERYFTYETQGEMQRALRGMIDRRLRKGYSLLYSYFGSGRFDNLQRHLAAFAAGGG